MSNKISIHFQPVIQKTGSMTVEKSMNGKVRRYLEGVSSGLKEDAHKERVSEKCLKQFMELANSGDILLFPDIHGIRQSEDIGILEKAEILPNSDWFTSYRLYDEDDNPGALKLEKINNIWKQCNGLPPYSKPKIMGFSIEGIIPDKGIIMSKSGDSILDNILLDGVVLVPRPAYLDSVANAVYKALNVLPPWREEKVKNIVKSQLNEFLHEQELTNMYWNKKFELNNAFQHIIEKIMADSQNMKGERLDIVFNEYKVAMINLLMKSQELFKQDNLEQDISKSIQSERNRERIYADLSKQFELLQKCYARRN